MNSEENINITYRNKNIFPRSKSFDSSSENLTDSFTDLDRSGSGKSLPDLSKAMLINENDVLKMEIRKLKMDLDRTTNEVDNLNTENYSLQKLIQSQQEKINKLKGLCTISASAKFHRKIQKNKLDSTPLLTDSINKSFDELNVKDMSPKNLTKRSKSSSVNLSSSPNLVMKQVINSVDEHQIPKSSCKIDCNLASKNMLESKIRENPEKNINCDKFNPATRNKHRVLLFSDENDRGVGKLLSKMCGSKFIVTTLKKPGASTDKLLENCLEICKDLNKSDFVVIVCGKHDRSPVKLESTLYYYLDKLHFTNVLICDVNLTRFLRVQRLRGLFLFICSQFSHCKFVSINTAFFHNEYVTLVSKYLLRDILHINYKIEFEYYNNEQKFKNISTPVYQKTYKTISTQTEPNSVTHSVSIQTENTEHFFRDHKECLDSSSQCSRP